MDYIDVYKENIVYSNAGNIITTIVQDSIRFEVLKPLIIYIDGKYHGTYRIVDKEVFQVKNLSKINSLLFFGERKEQGIFYLKGFPIKGQMSDDTEMAVIGLIWEKYEEKYDF